MSKLRPTIVVLCSEYFVCGEKKKFPELLLKNKVKNFNAFSSPSRNYSMDTHPAYTYNSFHIYVHKPHFYSVQFNSMDFLFSSTMGFLFNSLMGFWVQGYQSSDKIRLGIRSIFQRGKMFLYCLMNGNARIAQHRSLGHSLELFDYFDFHKQDSSFLGQTFPLMIQTTKTFYLIRNILMRRIYNALYSLILHSVTCEVWNSPHLVTTQCLCLL